MPFGLYHDHTDTLSTFLRYYNFDEDDDDGEPVYSDLAELGDLYDNASTWLCQAGLARRLPLFIFVNQPHSSPL